MWVFSVGAVILSLGLHKLGTASKESGWFSYETKKAVNPYEMTSSEDRTTVDGTESNSTSTGHPADNEWDYKNEELDVIHEENKIT